MADEIHLTDVEILTPAASSGARPGRATTSEPNVAITESFESVFKRDYTPVARMAYLMLGSTGEAEEVAQDAFAALLRRWDRIDNPSGFVRTAVRWAPKARNAGGYAGKGIRARRTCKTNRRG